jgi:hypothetical protein
MGGGLGATSLGIFKPLREILMKIILYTACLFIILCNNIILSQTHQFYGSFGYNIPTTTAIIGTDFNSESIKFNQSTFSKGIVFQGGYIYAINNNIQLDMNINYLLGVTDETYYSNEYNGQQLIRRYSNSNFAFSPSIKIKSDIGDLSPYVRFGCSLNFIKIKEEYDLPSSFSYSNEEYVYSGNFSFGWVGGVGIDYVIGENFLVFTELQLNSLTFYPDKLEYTRIDGDTRTTTIYHPKDTLPGGTGYSGLNGLIDIPFSSLGVLIGLRFSI